MILSHLLLCFLLCHYTGGLHLTNTRVSTAYSARTHNLSTSEPPVDTGNKGNLTVGIIIPKTTFNKRAYGKAINDTVRHLNKVVAGGKGPKFNFLRWFNFNPSNVKSTYFELTPSPTGKKLISEFHFHFRGYSSSAGEYF
uniref:Secreted protein n=1 Tax=Cacopsylla melanoneura TaxID=428564 RepID=A0A8D9B671_9HEMI